MNKPKNYYLLYRTGFVNREELIYYLEAYNGHVSDFFDDPDNRERLKKYNDIARRYEEKTYYFNNHIKQSQYEKAQGVLREIYFLRNEAIRIIELSIWYEELNREYTEIEILFEECPNFQKFTLDYFKGQLPKLKELIINRQYDEAEFIYSLSSSSLHNLNVIFKESRVAREIEDRLNFLKELVQETQKFDNLKEPTKYLVSDEIKRILEISEQYLKKGKLQLVDRLLGDLEFQVADRISFFKEYIKIDKPELNSNLRAVILNGSWAGGLEYILTSQIGELKSNLEQILKKDKA